MIATIISIVVAGIVVIVTRPWVAAVVIAGLIISISVSVRRRAIQGNVAAGGACAGYGLCLNEILISSIR